MANDKNNVSEAYKYAWQWFDYHAKQRLITFNFFLIIFGALSYGYTVSLPKCNDGDVIISFSIGIVGAIAAFLFLILEGRNTILVDDGRQALDKLEIDIRCFKQLGIRMEDKKRIGIIKEKNRKHDVLLRTAFLLYSHTFCFRFILSSAIALSLFAAFYVIEWLNGLTFIIIGTGSLIIFLISILWRIIIPIFKGFNGKAK